MGNVKFVLSHTLWKHLGQNEPKTDQISIEPKKDQLFDVSAQNEPCSIQSEPNLVIYLARLTFNAHLNRFGSDLNQIFLECTTSCIHIMKEWDYGGENCM